MLCALHAQISVGRLGIITELDFVITPQQYLTRTETTISWQQFVNWTMALQEGYKAAIASGSQAAIEAALEPADMVQVQIRGASLTPCIRMQYRCV